MQRESPMSLKVSLLRLQKGNKSFHFTKSILSEGEIGEPDQPIVSIAVVFGGRPDARGGVSYEVVRSISDNETLIRVRRRHEV